MITSVSAEGLDEEWLGHVLTQESYLELEKLSKKFDLILMAKVGNMKRLLSMDIT